MASVKQELILDLLSRKDGLTVAEVAEAVHLSVNAAYAHLRRLEAAGKIHVSGWSKGAKGRVPNQCYSFGYGVSVPYVSANPRPKKPKQETSPKKPKEPVEDINVYQIKHGAQIISHDNRLSYADHIRFMTAFVSHPDPASEWLFNQPAVELQGNKHE